MAQAITSYGPYYASSRRAIDVTNRALGKPTMSPETIAAERYGEIEAQRTDAQARRLEQYNREYQLGQLGIAQGGLTLQQQTAKNLEESQKVAGQYQLASMLSGGEGFGGMPGLGQTGQGTATGISQGNLSSQSTVQGGPGPYGDWTTFANNMAANAVGVGVTAATGNPLFGAGAKIATQVGIKVLGPTVQKGLEALKQEMAYNQPRNYAWDAKDIVNMSPAALQSANLNWSDILDAERGMELAGAAGIAGPSSANWGDVSEGSGLGIDFGDEGADVSGGDVGTVICTELHRQGILDDETYEADSAFGKTIPLDVLTGYQVWAREIVKVMKVSPMFTNVVALFALPWAKEMAYRMGKRDKGHILGKVLNMIGIPICGFIGRTLLSRKEVLANA